MGERRHKDELLVFGYGSLIWNPGFPFLDVKPARLDGWHRAFCVYSHHYRGTEARPGLVLGLDRGGECHGLLFRVAAEERDEVLAYLRKRELVTNVYLERVLPVTCHGLTCHGSARDAVTYVADPDHPQYAGRLAFETQVEMIAHAEGLAGRNRDYLSATTAELHRLGLADPNLDALHQAVEAVPIPPLGEHLNVAKGDEL